MSKYFLWLNISHGLNVKVCLRTPYKIQMYMVINGKTGIPKALHHNILHLIGIMLDKTIHNSLNGLKILNHLGPTNRINGKTNKTTGKINRTNGNHPKGIGNLQTNGGDLNSGLTKIPVVHNYHP